MKPADRPKKEERLKEMAALRQQLLESPQFIQGSSHDKRLVLTDLLQAHYGQPDTCREQGAYVFLVEDWYYLDEGLTFTITSVEDERGQLGLARAEVGVQLGEGDFFIVHLYQGGLDLLEQMSKDPWDRVWDDGE
jgi:hypothetical protein